MSTPGAAESGVAERFWGRWWPHVLELCLTLWVLRAPTVVLVIGGLLMWLVPQAQDLLVDLAMPGSIGGWVRIGVFYVLVFFVWAMPTHYGARILVDSDERYQHRVEENGTVFVTWLQEWTPRVLGVLTFVIMLGGVLRAWLNLPPFSDTSRIGAVSLHLIIVAGGLIVTGVLFWLYAVYRERAARSSPVVAAEKALGRLFGPVRSKFPALTAPRDRGSERHLGPILLLLTFVIFAALPIVAPLAFAEAMPRALSVPFVLGGWLPLLIYLSGLGRRFRFPFIIAGLALIYGLPALFGDNYAIRRINAADRVKQITGKDAPPRITDSIDLKVAIDWWKQANDCAGGGCPRPIVIAAAGGASRAGFFTASVIGQLLDDQLRPDGQGHSLGPGKMANRIFALSTVSGSSVGAVTTVAALAVARGTEHQDQPCVGSEEPLWRGSKIDSWRSCLEALMAGDFLTPIFTGFVFHDVFGFFKGADRGTLLERSVELQFAKLVGDKPENPGGLACVGHLDCPFMTLRPTPAHWLPLLVLNSTSVTSGQRIVTTALEWHIDPADPEKCLTGIRGTCQIFARAPLLHNLIMEKDPTRYDDFRISTAAHNSARFPLLSSPGALIDSGGWLIDRLVDGGYFENFGAQSATELAAAMMAIDSSLKPFVLVLSNDPQAIKGDRKSLPPAVHIDPRGVLTDIVGPLTAFANTRNARGQLAVDGAGSLLDHASATTCNTAQFQVWSAPVSKKREDAPPRELSMSWWLSKPVQTFQHEQTEFAGGKGLNGHQNKQPIEDVLAAIRTSPVDGGNAQPCRAPSD